MDKWQPIKNIVKPTPESPEIRISKKSVLIIKINNIVTTISHTPDKRYFFWISGDLF